MKSVRGPITDIEARMKDLEHLKAEKRGLVRKRLKDFAIAAAVSLISVPIGFSSALEFEKYPALFGRQHKLGAIIVKDLDQKVSAGNKAVIFIIDSQANTITVTPPDQGPAFPVPSAKLVRRTYSSVMSSNFADQTTDRLRHDQYRVLSSVTNGTFAQAARQTNVLTTGWGMAGGLLGALTIGLDGLAIFIMLPDKTYIGDKKRLQGRIGEASAGLEEKVISAEPADVKLDRYKRLMDGGRYEDAELFVKKYGLPEELAQQAEALEQGGEQISEMKVIERARRMLRK